MTNTGEFFLEKARKYCSIRETCRHDLTRKLRQWGAAADTIAFVLLKLEEEAFIDESRFARAVVHDKFRFEKWGKMKIRNFLLQHHIDETVVSEALRSIDDAEYRTLVFQELKKKNAAILKGSVWERKAKLFRFAQGRGYESDLTLQALDQLLAE